jgi:hypothetical protein
MDQFPALAVPDDQQLVLLTLASITRVSYIPLVKLIAVLIAVFRGHSLGGLFLIKNGLD